MTKINIPSPDELVKQPQATPMQEAMINSLVEILKNKFAGGTVKVTLKEILSKTPGKPEDEDRDKLELLMKGAGWKMTYDKPGYNETYYPSYYEISKKE